MKLQSRLLATNRILGRRGSSDAATAQADEADVPYTNMQSLAAELQQAAQTGQFAYPSDWVLVAKTFAVLAVILSVVHASFTLFALATAKGHTLLSLLDWTTLGALLSVAGAGLVAAVLVNLLPTVRVTPQGLGVSELTGWRYIPWKQISVLRVLELRNRGRYVVLIPFTGKTNPTTPSPMLDWLPALLGAAGWGGRGLLLTSHMKDFERLLQLIVSYMVQASGQRLASTPLEAYVDEDAVMPVPQLILDPEAEIVRIASNPAGRTELYGVSNEEVEKPIPWRKVLMRQLFIALVPVFVLLSDVLMRHQQRSVMWVHFVWALVLLILGVVELPFVAMLVRAVGELMVGSGQLYRTAWGYLELQVPRIVLVMTGGTLLAVGLPVIFTEALWLAGIVLTTLLTVRYVQRLYFMPLSHTLLAGLGTFIYQFMLLALYFGVR
jgi:hypothetical protein